MASLWDDDDVPQMDDCGSALALALHGTERKRERELNCTNIALVGLCLFGGLVVVLVIR